MRWFPISMTKVRPFLLLSALGLAACGATPKGEDVSRLVRSDLVPSTTEVLSATKLKDARRAAKNTSLQSRLADEASAVLEGTDYGVELDVVSFMIPDAMQAGITGARAFVAARITLRDATSGDMLVEGADITFVAPEGGAKVNDADALARAFGQHLKQSLQLR